MCCVFGKDSGCFNVMELSFGCFQYDVGILEKSIGGVMVEVECLR